MIGYILKILFFNLNCDAPEDWQFDFQDAGSPIMEGISDLHHDLMFFNAIIVTFVTWMLVRILMKFNSKSNPVPDKFNHGTAIEVVWTLLPAVMLMFVAVPTFALLYSMDEGIDPAVTIKAVGHQWYWSYEYSDYTNDTESLAFESYMVPEEDLELGHLRLLEVDNRVVVPVDTHIRVLVTSQDVIHNWCIPSLGIKMDAAPGRLNQISMFIKREGVFYGQCSELCGINHAFMPIVVEAVSLDDYVSWVSSQINL